MNSHIVLLVCLFSLSHGIFWQDCGSKEGKVNSVVVGGCPTTLDRQPCVLKKGNNATFEVYFTTDEASNKATSVVHGVVDGVPIPFKLPQPDSCKDSGLTCPLKANQNEAFHQSIPISENYPTIKLVVKWELKDDNGDDLFCINVLAQVTN